jgi:hypothetical protein
MTMTGKTETSEKEVGGIEGVQRCVMPDFNITSTILKEWTEGYKNNYGVLVDVQGFQSCRSYERPCLWLSIN